MMVELTTNDFNKVNFNVDIVTKIYSNTLEVDERQIFELICLKYDHMIRSKTIEPVSEKELVVRFYNILSRDIEFNNSDFSYSEFNGFDYIERILHYLKELISNPENIEIYINTVYRKYGIMFKIYRDIEICHMVVNLCKYGVPIHRYTLSKEKTLESLLDTIMKELYNYDNNISDYIVYIDEKTYKILTTINKQQLRKPFRYIYESIPIM